MPHSSITWTAQYTDGTFLHQREPGKPSKEEHSTQDIDRKRLKSLSLLRGNRLLLKQCFEPGQRLIFRRRVSLSNRGESTVYLLGWQRTIGGENVQHIAYLHEDNEHIEMAGRFRDEHPYDAPSFLPYEEQAVLEENT